MSVNVNKYFVLLESLRYENEKEKSASSPVTSDQNSEPQTSAARETLDSKEVFSHNLNILERFLKDIEVIWKINVSQLQLHERFSESINFEENSLWKYIAYLQHVVLTLINNINFQSDAKEDLISAKHMNFCIKVAQELGTCGLRKQLHPTFYNEGSMYKRMLPEFTGHSNYNLLYATIEVFHSVLKITQFHIANSMEFIIRDYVAAIFSLMLVSDERSSELTLDEVRTLDVKLNALWCDFLKEPYFRNLLLLKGTPNLPAVLARKLQQELLRKLRSADGFATLVATIQSSWEKGRQQDKAGSRLVGDSACCDVIANIVAHKGHSKSHQLKMIRQVNDYLDICLKNQLRMETISVGLLTLRRLCDLSDENRCLIEIILDGDVKPLTHPEDILSGLIVMGHKELLFLITKFYELFCSSVVECLPSQMVVKYLPVWLEVHHNILEKFVQKKQIGSLILRCLNNRSAADLETIVERIYMRILHKSWLRMNPRVMVTNDSEQTELLAKIVSSNAAEASDHGALSCLPTTLTDILLSSQHSTLVYRVFMALMKLMTNILLLKPSTSARVDNITLLESEDDLVNYLNLNYPARFDILVNLNRLIEHQPLRTQINEHSRDFLKFLRWLLEERLHNAPRSEDVEGLDQILLIILALCQEFMEQSDNPEQYAEFVPTLQRLRQASSNSLILERLEVLIALLKSEVRHQIKTSTKAFNEARTLLESPESHLRVYGIQVVLDLLKRRDTTTMASGHIIIGLALNILKSKESYAFLNCVRLFVGLIDVMEAEVLELLAGEYHNECADLDYRLVVGEAILKVCHEKGPMTYKYKDVLLNCFMHGARSTANEFRMSAFANLAQLCRILCYQVHSFFQELLNLIDCELSTAKYVPSKRSALLVLAEMLEGMDNLFEFEEMLLPIFRVLKAIEGDLNCDDKMRMHAANGLKALNEKCKKFLFPEQQLQREIQILGIKDKAAGKNKRAHILELN